ncbi:hypothetical protein O7631_27295 [Micromonospora sp. WMMD967]|uniref:hypothetical protein n=1 Tax=Micromonospora sp. WMMD967 TaxID=3016101 RepID=UPI0024172B32|nr:hypothetical protein [Micromonospora sp. WMMD967]MDG4840251.1 hypothetical protein [Micromonospora sp. WMMD967]
MAVDRNLWGAHGAQRTPTVVSVAIGWTGMVVASLLAAALFSRSEMPGRALVVAVAAGAFAAMVPDLRAVAAVTSLAMATFVGFLANQFGELIGGDGAWSYAVVICFAGVVGTGYRIMRQVRPVRREEAVPLRVVAEGASPGGRDVAAAAPDDAFDGRRAA